jgi:Fe-S cluster assembly protein SufD
VSADWLAIARNQAEERYRSIPEPGKKDENFRFTPVGELTALPPSVSGAAAANSELPASLITLDGEEESALLTLAGEEATTLGSARGLVFTDLERATIMAIDHVRSRLKEIPFAQDKFAQLTAARWKNGAFLHVPAGVKHDLPVRFVMAGAGESHFRNLLVLEAGAEATLVQECWSDDEAALITELTEIKLEAGAKLHWVILQRYGSATNAVVRQRLDLAEGAELRVTPIHLGAAKIQVRQEVVLQGATSQIELEGAARGARDQHFDFWTDVDHAGDRSQSQVNYSFVMGDSSRAVFNGLIQIRPRTLDCAAGQKAKSLLIGPKATVHAIPKLIIQTDAVKCSHGASVSSVNPEQVHYLQSRGIPKAEAERMIVRGFTEAVFERLPGEALHARASAELDRKSGERLQ